MLIMISDDFDLDKIADSGQCFRWEKAENEAGGTGLPAYRIIAGGRCLYVSALGQDRYDLDCSEEDFTAFWRDYFDLETDYAHIRGYIDPEKDPFLAAAAGHEKGIRILRQDPWEMLITFIISQNRNIPAIRRSVEMLAEHCGELRRDSRGRDYYAFPEPEAITALTQEELAACKLGYRCGYVHAAAEAVMSGAIDLAALASGVKTEGESDPGARQLIKTLTGLYGVGDKVASCVALFGLHQLDAFPVDTWIRRILKQEYPDGYPAERYSPYNGIYQQYMFAYYRHS